MIDPTSDRAAYQQVADLLRRRILDGEVTAGDQLPSETELMSEFGISRTTARQTYGVLREEGLIDSLKGRGAFVRLRRDARRVASDRYQQVAERLRSTNPQTGFTRDQGIDWPAYRLSKEFHEIPAAGTAAELLSVVPGTPLLARHFVFFAADEPEQMSVSYLPLDLVAGTAVADPDNEPWPGGTIAQLASLGVIVTQVDESVRARMPIPEERRTLHIPQGVPVMTITRRMLAGNRAVEAAVDIVMPADRFVLDYSIEVNPASEAGDNSDQKLP